MKIEVMLCISDLDRFLNAARVSSNIYWSPKIDGVRCWNIVENNEVRYFSRNGLEYKNFKIFDEGILTLYHNLKKFNLKDPVIFDSEVTTEDKNFRRVMTQVHRLKSVRPEILENYIFDLVLPNKPFKIRYNLLESLFTKMKSKNIFLLKHYPLKTIDKKEIFQLRNKIMKLGYEGLVLNTMDGPYQFKKRSIHCCKVKLKNTLDLEVIGFEYGTGRNAGRLGALICRYKGNKVYVGSGFTDQEREEFVRNTPKMIEVEYKEETHTGLLREVVFVRVRDDKI
jgi:DNA ligase 1